MVSRDPKNAALFGATGSIGDQTLDVIGRLGGYRLRVLTAGTRWKKLAELAHTWKPEMVVIGDDRHYRQLSDMLTGSGIKVLAGEEALSQVAQEADFELCINALVGTAGLMPSYYTLQRGIELALANKESLILAGDLLNRIAKDTGTRIIPIDSEHSAILQCLQGETKESVRRLILTASGGPFRTWQIEKIANASPEDALAHPTWEMGRKISIDSATLVNKGLEVIEAFHLFGLPPEQIEVRIHPVSIVHSMVEFKDGSFKAQMGKPDMRIPIQYALTYPDRIDADFSNDDPIFWHPLEFFEVDPRRYPCLETAYRVLKSGGTAAAVLNGADESAVERFLDGDIRFGRIHELIEEALSNHEIEPADDIETIRKADLWAREYVRNCAVSDSR